MNSLRKLVLALLWVVLTLGMTHAQDDAKSITADTASSVVQKHVIEGHIEGATSVAFSPDGGMLVTTGDDTAVRLWSAADWTMAGEYYEHSSFVKKAVFNPVDATQFVTMGWDAAVLVWSLTPEGAAVTRRLHEYSAVIEHASFSPDGQLLAFSVGDGSVHLVDMQTGEDVRQFQLNSLRVNAVSFTPDEARLILAAAGGFPEQNVLLWDAQTGEMLTVLAGHTAPVTAAAWNTDGDVLVTASADSTLILWRSESGNYLESNTATEPDWVTDLVFSPDNSVLAVALQNGNIQLLETATLRELAVLTAEDDNSAVNGLSFDPSGSLLASAHDSGRVYLWGID